MKNRKLSRISNDFILISDSMDLTMKTLPLKRRRKKDRDILRIPQLITPIKVKFCNDLNLTKLFIESKVISDSKVSPIDSRFIGAQTLLSLLSPDLEGPGAGKRFQTIL